MFISITFDLTESVKIYHFWSNSKELFKVEGKKKVSLPEKIVCYYLKQLFPDINESYKADWLGRKEIDMFIPSLKLVIEYDGQYFHSNIKRDEEKDKVILRNDIKVVRIREPECPLLSDGSYIITTSSPTNDRVYLESAIHKLIDLINEEYGLELNIDVDIKRDITKIIGEYREYFDSEYYGRSNRTRDELRKQAREEREIRVITLYNSGLTQEQVAKEIGCSVSTVIEILKRNNINRKTEHIRQIQIMKAEKFKQKEVAEILGISIATVKRYWNIAA